MRAAAAALLLLLAGCASPGRSIDLTAEQAALCEQQDDEEKPQPQKGRGA